MLETYFANRALIDFYRSVSLWIELQHPVGKETLVQSIAQLVPKHPALCCSIFGADQKSLRVVVLKQIDLDAVISFQDGSESDNFLPSLIRNTNETKFEFNIENTPLWKVVIYNNRFVFFVFDHSLFDGVSAKIFLKELANLALSASPPSSSDTDSRILSIPSNMSAPPALENLAKMTPPFSYVAKSMLAEFAPGWLRLKPKSNRNPLIYPPLFHPIYDGKQRLRVFSASQSIKLLQQARQHRTTVTAVICFVLCVAFGQTFEDSADVHLQVPLDARRFIPKSSDFPNPGDLIGPFVCQYSTDIPRVTEFNWHGAAALGDGLEQGTNLEALYVPALIKFLFGRVQEWMLSKLGQSRDNDIEVSNVGASDFPEGVSSFGFSQPIGTINPAIKLCVASVKGGKLSVTLTTADSIIGEGNGDKLWNRVVDILDKITADDAD